ncbi:MAG: hypothetical protein IPI11_18000 [Haliscomenobacter sp.]|nr:hypothetical protein [Haliscomenobacter sp.]
MRPFVFSLVLVIAFQQPATCSPDALRRLLLPFYSAQIPLSYDEQFPHWRQSSWDDKGIKNANRNLIQANPSPLLLSLLEAKQTYRLNDWLYVELISTAMDRILANHTPNEKELALWFFLKESGFHTRMASSGNELFVYALTEEEVYEVPLVADEGATFVNLTAIRQRKPEDNKSVYLLPLPEHPAGRPFSFHHNGTPAVPNQINLQRLPVPVSGSNPPPSDPHRPNGGAVDAALSAYPGRRLF